MGKNESFEFQDMGKYSSNSDVSNNAKKRGCFVTTTTGFILTLLAACLAVGVGLIVHFTGGDRVFECKCAFPEGSNGGTAGGIAGDKATTTAKPGEDPSLSKCVEWAGEGNNAICKYRFYIYIYRWDFTVSVECV